jgi:hypothetical protein
LPLEVEKLFGGAVDRGLGGVVHHAGRKLLVMRRADLVGRVAANAAFGAPAFRKAAGAEMASMGRRIAK